MALEEYLPTAPQMVYTGCVSVPSLRGIENDVTLKRYFVRGEKFVPVAMLMQNWLSLCTLQTRFGLSMWRGNSSFIFSNIVIHGTTARRAADSAICSLSAVLRAFSLCKQLDQKMGQFVYISTTLVCNSTLATSSASAFFQPPEKSAFI